MDMYELFQLGLKFKYGVPPDKEITAEDMIRNHAFTELARDIKKINPIGQDKD